MKRKKRVEAWVVRGHGGQSQTAIAYRHAETARGQAETWAAGPESIDSEKSLEQVAVLIKPVRRSRP